MLPTVTFEIPAYKKHIIVIVLNPILVTEDTYQPRLRYEGIHNATVTGVAFLPVPVPVTVDPRKDQDDDDTAAADDGNMMIMTPTEDAYRELHTTGGQGEGRHP